MEDIKELIKKAKKEEKKNPEFLYQLGLRFKNGEGTDKNEKKAAKYFEKAADLGHVQGQIETAIRWWKYWNSYYYANLYFQKAIDQGSEEAETILNEMKKEEQEKKLKKLKTESDNLIHVTNSKGSNLYDTPKFKDDDFTSFTKKHTFICCPACRGVIDITNHKTQGQLTEKVVTVYDKDTIFEHKTGPYEKPTYEGQTITQTYECESCKLKFDKVTHIRYEEKDKQETLKEMVTMTGGGTEWWKIVKISYVADKTKIGKDVLKILKKSEGKFEGRY